MNKRALRPCRKVGCSNLTRERYCEDHKILEEEDKAASNRYYDKYKRNKKHEIFYKSKEWRDTRENILTVFNYIDIYEYYINNKVRTATTVHHIIELEEDYDKRLDIYNLFPLSEKNHNIIDGLYKKDKKEYQKLLINLLEKYKKDMKIIL